MQHHLGKGIYLNYLVDLSLINEEHPSGYIFVLEQFGDRRGKIKRIKDNEIFTGYSPSRIQFEFSHKWAYLSQHSSNNLNKKCEYSLQYDRAILNSPDENLEGTLENLFKSFGYDPDTITEEDLKMSQNIGKYDEDETYEGTGREPPEETLNL